MEKCWQDIAGDTREKYNLYLCSPEWGAKRRKVFRRAHGFCERCRLSRIQEIHHLTYERKYDELLEDLQGICIPCHEFIHGHSATDPCVNEEWERNRVLQIQRLKEWSASRG